MSDTSLVNIIEGALLAAGKPMTVAQICDLFEEHEKPENKAVREAMQEVAERCEGRGFELVEVASGFRFQVRQSLSPWVGRLWQERPAKYSRALLETLALIAYRQPITRGEIEEIRGVAVSSNIIKTLHEREWIRVVGHRDVPGRPAMYATTRQFLDYFNLKSLDQLPALADIRDLETLNAELGFSEPLPGTEGEGENKAAPGLTVVGGTDHKPADAVDGISEAQVGADISAEGTLESPGETSAVNPEANAEASDEESTEESAQEGAETAAGEFDEAELEQLEPEQVEPESIEALADAAQELTDASPADEDASADPSRPESQG